MAPKQVEKKKKALIAFRLDENQVEAFDAAVETLAIPKTLGLSRSELARHVVLEWVQKVRTRRTGRST